VPAPATLTGTVIDRPAATGGLGARAGAQRRPDWVTISRETVSDATGATR